MSEFQFMTNNRSDLKSQKKLEQRYARTGRLKQENNEVGHSMFVGNNEVQHRGSVHTGSLFFMFHQMRHDSPGCTNDWTRYRE